MSKRLSGIFSNAPPEQKPLPTAPGGGSASNSPNREPTLPNVSVDDRSRSRSPAPGRVQKSAPYPHHARAPSGQYRIPSDSSQPSLQELKQQVAQRDQYGVPSPPLPPPTISGAGLDSRSSSRDRGSGSRPGTPLSAGSRPQTPTLQVPSQSPRALSRSGTEEKTKEKKRRFWSSSKKVQEERGPPAWIAGHPEKPAYDTDDLLQSQQVSELCDDADGNCFVYLFPRNSGRGPSFKIDSAVFASSPVLMRMAFGDLYSNQAAVTGDRRAMPLDARTQTLSVNDPSTPPATPERIGKTTSSTSSRDSRGRFSNVSSDSNGEAHLYLILRLSSTAPQPVDPKVAATPQDDLQLLVDHRNFFAFLCGQSLVATEKRSSLFHIFMIIAALLKAYEFSNLDGSTFGEVASSSFDSYVEELALNDVRTSREKTIEGIVLGEKMKSVLLYNEAFTHGVGKLDDLVSMKSPKFTLISSTSQNRLTRASMDLEKRTESIRLILTDFEFPSIFSGIMASKMAEERKEGVRFDAWKDSFLGCRRWFMGLLKHRYGAWPPKASSKKNNLETSGLNRLVLRDVYGDMSAMYDLLVDRDNLTTRTVDGIDLAGEKEEPTIRALRAVLSEYDRSSPPVKPPVPFDLPNMPSLKTTRRDFGTGDKKKDLKAIGKKIKDDEIAQILRGSWNDDTIVTPFVDAYRAMESKAAHGCTIAEIVDLRVGWWIFMYAVLQALPMLACDAPSLKYTKGAEYFLCEPPRSGVPWADPSKAQAAQRNWYKLEGTGGVVSLPSDVVEHGVEGIYRRSHCWVMAEMWSASNPLLNAALHEQEATNSSSQPGLPDSGASLNPPNGRFGGPLPAPPSPGALLRPNSRGGSPSRMSNRNSSLGIGLEALPLPMGVTPDGSASIERPRSSHAVDANKTFDAILADVGKRDKKGKKK